MALVRSFLAALVSFSLATFAIPGVPPGSLPPVGILTEAVPAHVDKALAFAGLSVFDGEELSTEPEGRISVRIGRSVLTLAGDTSAAVFHISEGIHVDLASGSLHFNGVDGQAAEVHVSEALLRTANKQASRAVVTLLAPKVLQVSAEKGGLNFSYRGESRYLPEG